MTLRPTRHLLPPRNEACLDKPVFVADVTIPDNTQNVPPGSTFVVSIEMIAPNDPGQHRSEWMFHIAAGPLLGVGADNQTPFTVWQALADVESNKLLQIKGEYSMNANGSVISTQGLSKSFGDVHALKSLDLHVPRNSIFAFLGPNGAGKTTTIKLLLGLTRPTNGGGTIFGKDIVKDSVDIRTNVGYLPQNAWFYEHMTARQTLDYTAKFFYKGPQSEINKRVDEMIELVGLTGKADRPIKGFSGGERQRLGIAQAEVNYPDLLILDEPAASLDPQGRRDVLEVMSRIRKYATIFYCTHILADVQRVSDQVAIVNHGELITQTSIGELLAGTGEIVYSVTLRGDAGSAYATIRELPWVSGIEVGREGEQTTWQVRVTDEAAAEDQLMNLLVSSNLKVSKFGRKEQNLEDVFINVVERSQK